MQKHLAKSENICYTYDKLSRVISKTVENTVTTTTTEETFTYDAAGNLLCNYSEQGQNCFEYTSNNRLSSYNGNYVSYDADGNITSVVLNGARRTLKYDSTNKLISAGQNAYTYNAENTRVKNLCGGIETSYVYDTNAKLSKLLTKTTGGVTTKYVYGRGLIGEETNNSFKTYHFDYRGSTVALTNINGAITDTFEYDTYGKLISRTGSTKILFMYNGRDGVVTDDNGLIYMRARYYSPELRRFVNADIIAGKIVNAITLNRYAYANGNPVSFVDPQGLSVDERNAYFEAYMKSNIDGTYKDIVNSFGLSIDDPLYEKELFNCFGIKIDFSVYMTYQSNDDAAVSLDPITGEITADLWKNEISGEGIGINAGIESSIYLTEEDKMLAIGVSSSFEAEQWSITKKSHTSKKSKTDIISLTYTPEDKLLPSITFELEIEIDNRTRAAAAIALVLFVVATAPVSVTATGAAAVTAGGLALLPA